VLPTVPKVRLEKESQGRLRWLEPDEERRLIAACKASALPHLADLVTVALETGMRRSEAERIDGMKRLASRLTWWHTLPHKSTPRSTPQRGEASHGPYWHRRAQEGKPDLCPGRRG
jgi:hypothetical protein